MSTSSILLTRLIWRGSTVKREPGQSIVARQTEEHSRSALAGTVSSPGTTRPTRQAPAPYRPTLTSPGRAPDIHGILRLCPTPPLAEGVRASGTPPTVSPPHVPPLPASSSTALQPPIAPAYLSSRALRA